MKKTLKIFSEVFLTTTDVIPLTEAVTLEFCYDHVNEDYPTFNPEQFRLPQREDKPLGIQETE
ncbi:MAG TPA: hypothetical protein VF141_21585 [Chryseolinea sp.]